MTHYRLIRSAASDIVCPGESPIEVIAEVILTALGEILWQIGAQILIEFGFGSIVKTARDRSYSHPAVTIVGALLLGGLVGVVTSLIWPTRIFAPSSWRGISLLLSPVITGLVMRQYGVWAERNRGYRSFLASFWGGALFAFGMAVVRLIWVSQ